MRIRASHLPAATDVSDATPGVGSTTRETFLGSSKDVNFAGPGRYSAGEDSFTYPSPQADDSFALSGSWDVETQFATPTADGAAVRLNFHAGTVEMVLAGTGEVRVALDDGSEKVIKVSGTPRSYSLATGVGGGQHVLEVKVAQGVEAYSFTFG